MGANNSLLATQHLPPWAPHKPLLEEVAAVSGPGQLWKSPRRPVLLAWSIRTSGAAALPALPAAPSLHPCTQVAPASPAGDGAGPITGQSRHPWAATSPVTHAPQALCTCRSQAVTAQARTHPLWIWRWEDQICSRHWRCRCLEDPAGACCRLLRPPRAWQLQPAQVSTLAVHCHHQDVPEGSNAPARPSRGSDVTGLECSLGTGSLQSSPGDVRVQPGVEPPG